MVSEWKNVTGAVDKNLASSSVNNQFSVSIGLNRGWIVKLFTVQRQSKSSCQNISKKFSVSFHAKANLFTNITYWKKINCVTRT
jgi:hypothetical protein